MTELKEVPTDELLSFQDYPTTHTSISNADPFAGAQINIDVSSSIPNNNFKDFDSGDIDSPKLEDDEGTGKPAVKSLWSIEYFQKFFDVDTKDVRMRLIGSVLPWKNNVLRNEIKLKPDLYGPFWISVTLVFTIAISGNIANYLQHANAQYHWKYDFHLVSYAATTIFMYISIVPLCLWGMLKWAAKQNGLEDFQEASPKALELICIYGYSLFIYIPISILWTIQINWLQWLLVVIAAFLSGAVLLLTLSSSLNASKHKIVFSVGIIGLHLLLAAGFMLFFFHVPQPTIIPQPPPVVTTPATNVSSA